MSMYVSLIWSPDMGPVHPRPLTSGYQQLVGVDTHASDVLGVACTRQYRVNKITRLQVDCVAYLSSAADSGPQHCTGQPQLPQSRSSHLKFNWWNEMVNRTSSFLPVGRRWRFALASFPLYPYTHSSLSLAWGAGVTYSETKTYQNLPFHSIYDVHLVNGVRVQLGGGTDQVDLAAAELEPDDPLIRAVVTLLGAVPQLEEKTAS